MLSIYFHNPTAKGFERIVKLLKLLRFRFVNLNELLAQHEEHRVKRWQVFVSFDDGWNGNLKLIPLIEKHQVPVTIFVTVDTMTSGNFWWEPILKVKGYDELVRLKKGDYDELLRQIRITSQQVALTRSAITVDELRQLANNDLVTIGSHTMTHPLLDKVSPEQLMYELMESQRALSELCQKEIKAFSYPNGNFTDREVDACSRYYSLAFTTVPDYLTNVDNRYLLPRICLTGSFGRDLLKLARIWPLLKRLLKH